MVSKVASDGRVDSLLRWAGSKRAHIPTLLGIAPSEYGRYIEPFAGSACLFFALKPKEALLADFNVSLIEMYRSVKVDCAGVAKALSQFDNAGDDYYEVRDSFNAGLDPAASAAAFLYLNRFGFNGIFRTNRLGAYNVPRGTRTGPAITEDELAAVSARLQGVQLESWGYETTIEQAREGDFLYVDPPYATTHRSTYGEYGYGGYSPGLDQETLVKAITSAVDRGVQVLFSYGSSGGLDEMLDGWSLLEFETKRRISSRVDRRSTTYSEVIAASYTPERVGAS